MNRAGWLVSLGLTAALTTGASAAERIVPLGGDVTEIVFALGEGSKVVCVDQTARHPQSVLSLPQVGYVRNLAAEGILSCRPDLVIASQQAGPPAVLSQLASARVPLVRITEEQTLEGTLEKIDQVADALGMAERGARLSTKLKTDVDAVRSAVAGARTKPKVLFVMGQGAAGLQAAGIETPADAIIRMAMGENIAPFEGYKPFTREAAAALAPDVILVADFSVQALGGIEATRARPEFMLTPAGRNGRVFLADTMMLIGFGPRTAEGLAWLAKLLHPDLTSPTITQSP
jgi:iron complex transport system substrate-binding protein